VLNLPTSLSGLWVRVFLYDWLKKDSYVIEKDLYVRSDG
jgi:hypothetical protein